MKRAWIITGVLMILLGASLLLAGNPGGLFHIPESNLIFSHTLHVTEIEIECLMCHASIESSTTGNDRNIPEMEVCGECHDVDDDEACGMCHRDPDDPLPGIDADWQIVFNHQMHLSRGLDCTRCHAGVEDAEVLTEANMPTMSLCFECHDGDQAPNDCALCHGDHITLSDIHPSDWRRQHAERAVSDRSWCSSCHIGESFCLNCHRGDHLDDQIHGLNYMYTHGLDAKGKDADCAQCHDTRAFCNDCHESNTRIPLRHSTLSWLADHGEEARRDPENCASCHDSADPTCARTGCHADYDGVRGTDARIHDLSGGMLSSHGQWHDDPTAFCYQCHVDTRAAGIGFCGYCHGDDD